MKRWVLWLLRWLVLWLDPPPVIAPPDPASVDDMARVLMAGADAHERTGDHKRRLVLAGLRKQFPTIRGRDLGFVIERLMQERP